MKSSLWSVVLAAGAGRRLSRLTGGIPKQFWRPAGTTSLIEETLARLAPICPAQRTVIVVNKAQRHYVSPWPSAPPSGRIAFQPEDRGTAAGVLFGLTEVLALERNAIVVVTPSDHGVESPETFRRGILDAATHVEGRDGVVLFGVEPSAAQTDYGWITLDPATESGGVQPVVSFVEKPALEEARRLLSSGAIWNTMVIVARAGTLFALCEQQVSDLTAVFTSSMSLPEDVREAFLAAHYPHLEAADFSRDVLTPAANLLAYAWPASIGWSDLGTPERLHHWLRPKSGKHPRLSSASEDTRRADLVNAAT
jgi:mannose-1-phosphate guanylyltransferase